MSRLLGRVATALVTAVAAVGTVVLVGNAPTVSAAVTTFTPVADTYVQNDAPTTNYGTSSQLDVDNSPIRRTFIRFAVSGVSGTVTSAKLRLHVDDISNGGSPSGGTMKKMTNTTWSETGTTWNNQPAIDGATMGSLGSVARNTWYEIDVTEGVTCNGSYSFGLTSSNSDGAYYDSRSTGTTSPQLVVTTGTTTTTAPTTTTSAPGADPVILGAGDIASCSSSGDEATAALLAGQSGTVITTGDNVYANGTTTEFNNCYNPSWGAHKARTRPSPGNHDYGTSGAAGYFNYFGAAAGDSSKGYYSYDLGNWHVVSLNSNCSMVSCGAGSAQEQWLRADLAASTKPCTVAYWHHARFSSGTSDGSNSSVQPLYQALYDNNADLALVGHEHNYERFAPMTATGSIDTARGIRQFVIGTGGRSHYGFGTPITGSEVRNSTAYGVLKVTLKSNSYDWQFLPVAGQTFTDSGTTACH